MFCAHSGYLQAYLVAGTLWAVVCAHIASCQQGRYLSWNEARQSYNSIKELSRLINNLYGRRITVTLMATLVYYSVTFGTIKTFKRLLHKFFLAMSDAAFLVIAADITHQVC